MDKASQSTLSRTTLATFAGMTLEVDRADYYLPQIHVTVEETAYRFALLGEGFAGDTPIAPPPIRLKLEAWFDMIMPTVGRTVAALVYDQWLRARNGRPAEMVPPPEQIHKMDYLPRKPIFVGDYYAIKSIGVLPNFHLRVTFLNDQIRVANIKEMRGDSSLWQDVFAHFGGAENHIHHVEWPVLFEDGPNTLEIEDQDLWGAGILVGSDQV